MQVELEVLDAFSRSHRPPGEPVITKLELTQLGSNSTPATTPTNTCPDAEKKRRQTVTKTKVFIRVSEGVLQAPTNPSEVNWMLALLLSYFTCCGCFMFSPLHVLFLSLGSSFFLHFTIHALLQLCHRYHKTLQ